MKKLFCYLSSIYISFLFILFSCKNPDSPPTPELPSLPPPLLVHKPLLGGHSYSDSYIPNWSGTLWAQTETNKISTFSSRTGKSYQSFDCPSSSIYPIELPGNDTGPFGLCFDKNGFAFIWVVPSSGTELQKIGEHISLDEKTMVSAFYQGNRDPYLMVLDTYKRVLLFEPNQQKEWVLQNISSLDQDVLSSQKFSLGYVQKSKFVSISDRQGWLITSHENDPAIYIWSWQVVWDPEQKHHSIKLQFTEKITKDIGKVQDINTYIDQDFTHVTIATDKGVLIVWTLNSMGQVIYFRKISAETDSLETVAFMPIKSPEKVFEDEKLVSNKVISTGKDGVVQIWDFWTGKLLYQGIGNQGNVRNIQFIYERATYPYAYDEAAIISLGADKTLRKWSLEGLVEDFDIGYGCLGKTSVNFSKTGDRLLTATGYSGCYSSSDYSAMLWKREKPSNRWIKVQELSGHKKGVLYANFSSDETQIVTGTEGGDVQIWRWDATQKKYNSFQPLPSAHGNDVTTTEFSKTGTWLLTVGKDRKGIVWQQNTATGMYQKFQELPTTGGYLNWGIFLPQEDRLIINQDDETARVWEWDATNKKFIAGQILQSDPREPSYFLDAHASKDGQWLISSHPNRIIVLWKWNPTKNEFVQSSYEAPNDWWSTHNDGLVHLADSGKYAVLTDHNEEKGKIFSIRDSDSSPTFSEQRVFKSTPYSFLNRAVFSPDDKWIAVVGMIAGNAWLQIFSTQEQVTERWQVQF